MTRLLLIFGLFLTFFSSGAAYAKDSTTSAQSSTELSFSSIQKEASFTIPADYSKELSAQKENYFIAFTPVSAHSKNAETSDNTLLYRDVQPETNIIYQALNFGLKESIVLKSASSPKEFSWQMKVSPNLKIMQSGQKIEFFEKSANISSSSAEISPIFEIPAPFMVDSKGNRSENVKVEIKQGVLTLTADQEWLKTAVYPVVLDPTIYSGPNSPSTTIDDATVGTVAWTNPNDSQTSNNLYAAAIPPAGDNTTHYLKTTGLGFAIPATAIIKGIVVEIERKDIPAASGSYSKDSTVRIVKGGTIGATDRADTTTNWPTTDTYKTYGGSSDLWGLTWTPTDINASSFGAAISAFVRTPISCYVNSDHDGYGAGSVQNCYGSIGTGYSANNTDCSDGNASLYQNLTGYQDSDMDNYTTGGAQSVCSGSSLPYGWRSYSNGSDCNDGNSSVWQNLTGYRDADGDTYGAAGAGSYCSGASLPAGYVTNGSDCYDGNRNARPGQTGWFTSNRGDGSFDYNCILGTTKRYTAVSNMPAVGSCVGTESCPNRAYYEGLESDVACGVASATKIIDWRNNNLCSYGFGNGGTCRGSGSSLCCAGTDNTSYLVARIGSTVQECQ